MFWRLFKCRESAGVTQDLNTDPTLVSPLNCDKTKRFILWWSHQVWLWSSFSPEQQSLVLSVRFRILLVMCQKLTNQLSWGRRASRGCLLVSFDLVLSCQTYMRSVVRRHWLDVGFTEQSRSVQAAPFKLSWIAFTLVLWFDLDQELMTLFHFFSHDVILRVYFL